MCLNIHQWMEKINSTNVLAHCQSSSDVALPSSPVLSCLQHAHLHLCSLVMYLMTTLDLYLHTLLVHRLPSSTAYQCSPGVFVRDLSDVAVGTPPPFRSWWSKWDVANGHSICGRRVKLYPGWGWFGRTPLSFIGLCCSQLGVARNATQWQTWLNGEYHC
jgi:hypothetical protein